MTTTARVTTFLLVLLIASLVSGSVVHQQCHGEAQGGSPYALYHVAERLRECNPMETGCIVNILSGDVQMNTRFHNSIFGTIAEVGVVVEDHQIHFTCDADEMRLAVDHEQVHPGQIHHVSNSTAMIYSESHSQSYATVRSHSYLISVEKHMMEGKCVLGLAVQDERLLYNLNVLETLLLRHDKDSSQLVVPGGAIFARHTPHLAINVKGRPALGHSVVENSDSIPMMLRDPRCGCTLPTAVNYDRNAVFEDGSCMVEGDRGDSFLLWSTDISRKGISTSLSSHIQTHLHSVFTNTASELKLISSWVVRSVLHAVTTKPSTEIPASGSSSWTVRTVASTLPEKKASNRVPAPDYVRASWRSIVVSSNPDASLRRSCNTTLGGWQAIDPVETLKVLEKSGQNTYLLQVEATDACEKQRFEDFAAYLESVGSSLNLYLVFSRGMGTAQQYAEQILWVRSVAAKSRNVVGYAVDDFQGNLVRPWLPYDPPKMNVSDVREYFYGAAHNTTQEGYPEIDFMFYMPDWYTGIYTLRSYWFGVFGGSTKDYEMYVAGNGLLGDYVAMTGLFNVTKTQKYRLSTLMFSLMEEPTKAGQDLVVTVAFQGTQVGKKSVVQLPDTLPFSANVGVVTEGLASVSFNLSAVGATFHSYMPTVAYVWEVHLVGEDGTVVQMMDTVSFDAYRDPKRNLQWVAETTYAASANDRFRMEHYSDALMTKIDQFALLSNDTSEATLTSACGHYKALGKKCYSCFWGENWKHVPSLNFTVQVQQFDNALRYSDGTIIWRLTNSLGAPESGIFAPRRAFNASFYDVMAYFPRELSGPKHYYLMWEVQLNVSGVWTLQFTDRGYGQPDGRDFFNTTVLIQSRSEWTSVFTKSTSVAPHIMNVPMQVSHPTIARFGLFEVQCVGDYDDWVEFRLTDPHNNIVDLSTATIVSGVDPESAHMWQCANAFFKMDDYASICTQKYDAELM